MKEISLTKSGPLPAHINWKIIHRQISVLAPVNSQVDSLQVMEAMRLAFKDATKKVRQDLNIAADDVSLLLLLFLFYNELES